MIHTTVLADGGRNWTLQLIGEISTDLALDEIKPDKAPPTKIHLASAVWLIQEKMGLALWWDKGQNLAIVMESRNSVRFENGLRPPKGWDGRFFLEAFNVRIPQAASKRFIAHLEFDK